MSSKNQSSSSANAETETASAPEPETVPAITGPHVYQGIAQVIHDLSKEGIAKGRKNTQQNYSFRGIDDVYNVLSSVLAARKVMLIPRIVSQSTTTHTSAQNKEMFRVCVEVDYDIISAIDGSKHTARFPGEALDTSDKATNKAMTAAFKYLCFQLFCIPLEGMDDADATTHEVRKPEPPRAAPPPPDLSPQEFIDLIEVAPTLDALKKVFEQAWRAYTDQDFRESFTAAKEKRKLQLTKSEGDDS